MIARRPFIALAGAALAGIVAGPALAALRDATGESVVARLDLSGESDILTVLSGREKTVRLLDEIRASVGDDPADWMTPLLERA